MKIGDKFVYIGETIKQIKKYSIGKLILEYHDNKSVIFYNYEYDYTQSNYDPEKIVILDKSLFISFNDYRKQKLEKINSILK